MYLEDSEEALETHGSLDGQGTHSASAIVLTVLLVFFCRSRSVILFLPPAKSRCTRVEQDVLSGWEGQGRTWP